MIYGFKDNRSKVDISQISTLAEQVSALSNKLDSITEHKNVTVSNSLFATGHDIKVQKVHDSCQMYIAGSLANSLTIASHESAILFKLPDDCTPIGTSSRDLYLKQYNLPVTINSTVSSNLIMQIKEVSNMTAVCLYNKSDSSVTISTTDVISCYATWLTNKE